MTAFRLFKQYDGPAGARALKRRILLRPKHAEHFAGEGLPAQFARALCEEQALSLKELLEAFEFFQVVREYTAAPHVADVCAGHGLVGVLFALFERKVDTVTLVDRQQPMSYERILAAADRVGPWARDKLTFQKTTLKNADALPPGTSVIAVHACGLRTDRAMDLAIQVEGAFACLPCCRPHRRYPSPDVLKRELGGDLAVDVHRTYTLERAGYRVRWKTIPETITPMNRVLIGVKDAAPPLTRN
jgi:hypothetical protein